MKALSIRQPYAHNIIFDGKDVENRTWRTHYRGPVLIHASKNHQGIDKQDRLRFQFGGIVGMAEIVDCVREMPRHSPWFYGPWGFVLENAKELPFLPCKGSLSFFTPSIRAQIAQLWHDGTLSEGQGAKILSLDRVSFRRLCDEQKK